jgi:hypothetical protein
MSVWLRLMREESPGDQALLWGLSRLSVWDPLVLRFILFVLPLSGDDVYHIVLRGDLGLFDGASGEFSLRIWLLDAELETRLGWGVDVYLRTFNTTISPLSSTRRITSTTLRFSTDRPLTWMILSPIARLPSRAAAEPGIILLT